MEHRLIPAVLAKECNVLTQIHILQVISHKAPITSLHPFAEFEPHAFNTG